MAVKGARYRLPVDFDAIVIGLGAMGSAAAYHLAKAGVRVLGIDRHDPPHEFGSSHGDTRITRLAVGEGEEYVALVRRSHELWREIEAQTGRHLLEQCGGLIMGVDPGHSQHGAPDFVRRTIDIAKRNAIPHETLTTGDIRSRFPQFNVADGTFGYFEPTAGYLRPEECVRAQHELAKEHGATLHSNERVLSWRSHGNAVTVTTTDAVYYRRQPGHLRGPVDSGVAAGIQGQLLHPPPGPVLVRLHRRSLLCGPSRAAHPYLGLRQRS